MAACGVKVTVYLDGWSDVFIDFYERIADRFARTKCASDCGAICAACSAASNARTVDNWRRSAIPIRRVCNACCERRAGMPMRCVMTCGATLSSTSGAKRAAC